MTTSLQRIARIVLGAGRGRLPTCSDRVAQQPGQARRAGLLRRRDPVESLPEELQSAVRPAARARCGAGRNRDHRLPRPSRLPVLVCQRRTVTALLSRRGVNPVACAATALLRPPTKLGLEPANSRILASITCLAVRLRECDDVTATLCSDLSSAASRRATSTRS